MKALLVIIAAITALMTTACAVNESNQPRNIGQTKIIAPLDYGNGVYYFPIVSAEFGNSLSAFIKQHPEMEMLSIAPTDEGYQSIHGYFVIFKNKRQKDDFMP
jgi:hypothetical protein